MHRKAARAGGLSDLKDEGLGEWKDLGTGESESESASAGGDLESILKAIGGSEVQPLIGADLH